MLITGSIGTVTKLTKNTFTKTFLPPILPNGSEEDVLVSPCTPGKPSSNCPAVCHIILINCANYLFYFISLLVSDCLVDFLLNSIKGQTYVMSSLLTTFISNMLPFLYSKVIFAGFCFLQQIIIGKENDSLLLYTHQAFIIMQTLLVKLVIFFLL